MEVVSKANTPRTPTPPGLESLMALSIWLSPRRQAKLSECEEVTNWVRDNVAF